MNYLIDDFNCDQFVSIFKRALSEKGRVDIDTLDDLIKRMNQIKDIWALMLPIDNNIIGFIQYQILYFSDGFFKEKYGFIREFWIEPEYRYSGFGKKLLKDCETHIEEMGINQFILLALPDSEGFYQKQGYRINNNYISFNNLTVMTKSKHMSEKVLI